MMTKKVIAVLSVTVLLVACRTVEAQQTNLSASAELVHAIRQLEEKHGTNAFEVLRRNVARKTQDLIVVRGLASFTNEQCRYATNAPPARVEVRKDGIDVTEPGICIWKLTPVVTDGILREVRAAYVPICREDL